jgi:non-ribosomal peptide synthetase component E (peptide arylation enzyme)
VAVVGLPDARLGELVCACVVLRDGDLDLEALVGYLRSAGLALYKMPQRLVLLDALPMTPTGKIRKFELVAQIADDRTGEDHQ